MSKMGLHHPYGHLKHKLWLKKGPGVKLVVWLLTTKSKKSTRFPYVQVACEIPLEDFDEGYNFALDRISIGGLHVKLWRPKVVGVLTLVISGLPLRSPGTKSHLDVGPMERHIVYYKGEGGGFPQVWVVVSLVSSSRPCFVLTPKVFQLCTNHLGFVQASVSKWSLLILPSPFPELQHAPLPLQSAASQGVCPTPYSSTVFYLGLTFESFKELWARQFLSYIVQTFPISFKIIPTLHPTTDLHPFLPLSMPWILPKINYVVSWIHCYLWIHCHNWKVWFLGPPLELITTFH